MKYSHKTGKSGSWIGLQTHLGLNPREHYLLEPPKEEASALMEPHPTIFMGKRSFL